MTRILLTRRWPDAAQRRMSELGEVTLNPSDRPMSREALRRALAEYDVVCPTVTDALPADVWPDAPRARLLCNFGVGVNHIDLEAARSHGAAVTNTPGVLTEATAEIALTLLLMVARRAGEGERMLRAGGWTGWGPTQLLGRGLSGKTLGVVGMGRIGQAVARKAHHGLGMSIVYNARRRAPEAVETETGAVWEPSLDNMVGTADAITLHCPGGAETRHLIDAGRLARMKPTAILINTARGAVVDEAALAAALEAGSIGGAGLDVYENEPAVHQGLISCDRAVLLPHLGSATEETRLAMGLTCAENLAEFVQGRRPRDQVA